jgi:hypothetical protein
MRTFFSLVLCLWCASFAWADDKPVFEIEVTIAEWNAKAKEGAALPEVDYKAIEKSGALTVLQRIKLTTVADVPALAQIGERRPEVTGSSVVAAARFGGADGGRGAGGPRVAQSISYMNYGTVVSAKASGNSDRIVVELMVERSGPNASGKNPIVSDGGDGAEGPEGGRVRAVSMNTVKAQSTVALKSGETVVVAGSNGREGDSTGGHVVLLTAKLLK